jgi:glyoxylase-like metal-dependent hydrolase (beta-lactamase superfamily II)
VTDNRADHPACGRDPLARGPWTHCSAHAVTAVLVAHAHNDHIGSAERLPSQYGVPVLMHDEEVPHTRRDHLDQVSEGQVLTQAWRPGAV